MSDLPEGVIYNCHFFGGPKDGEVVTCLRPYCELRIPGEGIYRAKSDVFDDYVEWADDQTRRIDLHFSGPNDP